MRTGPKSLARRLQKSLVYYKVRKNRKSLNRNLSGLGTYIILCLTKSKCQRQEGTTQKLVYSELGEIRELRNRIAHHEPICFDSTGNVSTAFASKHYSLIIKYMTAMGLDVKSVLYRIESPKAIIARINKVF